MAGGEPIVRPWGERSFHADDPSRPSAKWRLGCRAGAAMPPAMSATPARSRSRSAARLAAVQALYQQEMEKTPLPVLLHEFHHHRLGATIEGVEYADAEVDFFDDLVSGVHARSDELDRLIAARLARDWSLARLDKPMRQILRAGAYELVACIDVPTGSIISEYVELAKAFYDRRETNFVNGLLDALAKDVRK
jgi:N utilization substance protein B